MLMEQNHHQHKLIKSMKNFDEYIDWRINEDLSLQKNFFYENDICIVDAIGRIENLESDFHKICGEIGVETQLHHLNASRAVGDDFLKRYSEDLKNKKTLHFVECRPKVFKYMLDLDIYDTFLYTNEQIISLCKITLFQHQ